MYSSLPSDLRTEHPYHMYDEIKAQPGAVGRSLSLADQHAEPLAHAIARSRRIILTGCGTSLHAAIVGAWMLRMQSRGALDAHATGAHEVAAYPVGLTPADLLIAITHSGETTMTRRAVQRSHDAGATTAVVTGFPDRIDGALVDHTLPTGFPEERSWAHTASYVAAITSLAALANAVSHPAERLDLSPLPEVVREALQLEEMTHRMAASTILIERYRDPARIVIVGPGPNAATAREGVLKLLETSYVEATALELEYALHGPLAAVTAETLVILLAPHGAATDRTVEFARAVQHLGVIPIVLAGLDTAERYDGGHRLVLPDLPEVLSPIPYVVPLQLFSYFLAVGKGTNPDLLRRDDDRYRAARAQYS